MTALFQISGEKAPGPDDFTLTFFHHCWVGVKIEVLNTIQEPFFFFLINNKFD